MFGNSDFLSFNFSLNASFASLQDDSLPILANSKTPIVFYKRFRKHYEIYLQVYPHALYEFLLIDSA